MKEPILIKYYCISEESYKTNYLLREEEGRVFLCTTFTYYLAEKISKTKDLTTVKSSFSLPSAYCKYKHVYNFKEKTFKNSFLNSNINDLLVIIEKNFDSICSIADFIELFDENTNANNFEKKLTIAHILYGQNLTENITQKLFDLVLNHFYNQFKENRLSLLLNEHVGLLVAKHQKMKKQ